MLGFWILIVFLAANVAFLLSGNASNPELNFIAVIACFIGAIYVASDIENKEN